ncbi:HAD-IC family P-type ATPase [Nakamurella endophytica]|uniref:HAD-IC family P-type ATPase n=1 Tax=Nakamurella endophytica TaxID=1748367 RepID=UPI00227AB2ED|nr:HAD-IC family P-type ATPase [Nakamurella endophytica]
MTTPSAAPAGRAAAGAPDRAVATPVPGTADLAVPAAPDLVAERGLTAAEVAERIAQGRTNATDAGLSRSVWQIVRANVFTRFNAILGALFVLILITGSFADGVFGIVLIVNSGIGIVQEYLAKRKLDRLALLHAPTIRVVRDGRTVEIPTADVVQDDLIELRTGDQVPADGRLTSASGLELNESNLTGESDSIPKAPGDEVRSGTSVVAGTGRFTAAAVGADAYANRIAAEARRFTRTRSEIQDSVNRLLKYITWVIVIALPLQIWSQYRAIGDQGWREVVIRSTGGLVGLVPEGLVLLTSVAFLLAAVQLTRQQVLVQELPAVEGLARVDVVCLDKTGTLTVGDIVFEDLLPLDVYDEQDLREALGALADDANANGTLKAVADAIPAPQDWERRHTVAFNSARKWSAATFAGARGTWVMGAPDVLVRGHEDGAEEIRHRVGELAGTGRRVLLLANTDQALHGQDLPGGIVPRALVVLSEQVRPDAKETLDFFAAQGVAIKIISGDNPTTVAAIARRVGLEVGPEGAVDARTIGSTPEELRDIVERTTVFGRVSPEQKRALVNALKMNGHVAAMTGDGVNDALALKDADIGVAMNNGAQATKAVAQLVLLDGRFSHLPSVLAEGRRVIGNVERVANLFVAKNVMSLIAIVSAAVAALPFPFLPRHLTLVSAVTIGIPSFFLALGPNKRRYLPGFLRRVLRFAVPAGVIAGLVVLVSYLVAKKEPALLAWEAAGGCKGPAAELASAKQICWHPSTAATVALLITFFWILVVLARPLRAWKAGLVFGLIGVTVLVFLVPAGRDFFDFAFTPALLWQSLLVGAAGAVAIEVVYRTTPGMKAATS